MKKDYSPGRMLRTGGIITVLASLILGILFIFTIGRSCGFVGGLGILGFLFLTLAGIVAFISGVVLINRDKTTEE